MASGDTYAYPATRALLIRVALEKGFFSPGKASTPQRVTLKMDLERSPHDLFVSAQRKFKKAFRLQRAGQVDAAIRILEKLLAAQDLSGFAASSLRTIYLRQGRSAEAIRVCEYLRQIIDLAIKNKSYSKPYGRALAELRRVKRWVQQELRELKRSRRSIKVNEVDWSFGRREGAWIMRGRHNAGVANHRELPPCICLAWPELGNVSEIAMTDLPTHVVRIFADRTPSFLKAAVNDLGRFIFGMKLNDVIISHEPEKELWIVGTVTGEYTHDPAQDPAFPHIRSVEWIGTFRDNVLPDAAKLRLRRFTTIRDLGPVLRSHVNGLITKMKSVPGRPPVPRWEPRSRIANAPKLQREQFLQSFLAAAAKGEYLDVDGNSEYVRALISHVFTSYRRTKDIPRLLSDFEAIRQNYGHVTGIASSIDSAASDLHIYLGDFDSAWQHIRKMRLNVSTILNIRGKCTTTILDGSDLLSLTGETAITEVGRQLRNDLTDVLTETLALQYERTGRNFVEELCSSLDMFALTAMDLDRLEGLCRNSAEEFNRLKLLYGSGPEKDRVQRDVYRGGIRERQQRSRFGKRRHSNFDTEIVVPPVIEHAVQSIAATLVSDADNVLRDRLKIPRIGQGWLNETVLFRAISAAFPEHEVVQHWKSSWLGHQHLDVFITGMNIALEYQGEQHSRPVEFFGGDEGFRERRKRDKTKARLCQKNGVGLLHVHPGYCIDDVLVQIRGLMPPMPAE